MEDAVRSCARQTSFAAFRNTCLAPSRFRPRNTAASNAVSTSVANSCAQAELNSACKRSFQLRSIIPKSPVPSCPPPHFSARSIGSTIVGLGAERADTIGLLLLSGRVGCGSGHSNACALTLDPSQIAVRTGNGLARNPNHTGINIASLRRRHFFPSVCLLRAAYKRNNKRNNKQKQQTETTNRNNKAQQQNETTNETTNDTTNETTNETTNCCFVCCCCLLFVVSSTLLRCVRRTSSSQGRHHTPRQGNRLPPDDPQPLQLTTRWRRLL